MAVRKGNVHSPLRWSLAASCAEFGVHEDTVLQRLTRAGEKSGLDGCWSTAQITGVVFGDLNSQRIRETSARADHWRLRVRALQSELLNRADLELALASVFTSIRQIIDTSSEMSRRVKSDVLGAISQVPIVVKDVAARQNRELGGDRKPTKNGEEEAEAVDAA
jgi:hypothetical protein